MKRNRTQYQKNWISAKRAVRRTSGNECNQDEERTDSECSSIFSDNELGQNLTDFSNENDRDLADVALTIDIIFHRKM